MDLIASISSPESTWNHVKKLAAQGEWDSVIYLINKEHAGAFKPEGEATVIPIDYSLPAETVIEQLKKELNGKFSDIEAGLNIVSGSGKEHMCILAAMLKLGIGVRLMALTRDGVKEL